MNEHGPHALGDALARVARFDADPRATDDVSAADDAAYRVLLAQTEDPVDPDRFVDRVMSATRRMPVTRVSPAPALRPLRWAWWKRAAAATIAATAVPWVLWLWVGGIDSVSVGVVAASVIDMWSASVAVGVVLGRALTHLDVALGLAVATGVGGGSVFGLVRMLSTEEEVSTWTDRSSLA